MTRREAMTPAVQLLALAGLAPVAHTGLSVAYEPLPSSSPTALTPAQQLQLAEVIRVIAVRVARESAERRETRCVAPRVVAAVVAGQLYIDNLGGALWGDLDAPLLDTDLTTGRTAA